MLIKVGDRIYSYNTELELCGEDSVLWIGIKHVVITWGDSEIMIPIKELNQIPVDEKQFAYKDVLFFTSNVSADEVAEARRTLLKLVKMGKERSFCLSLNQCKAIEKILNEEGEK